MALALTASRCEYLSQPYFERFDARAAEGDLPDVGYVEAYRAPSYASEGLLQPLDEVLPESIETADQLLISFFQNGGETYAVPRDFQTLALLLNMDLLASAGWTNPPQNWDELLTASFDVAANTESSGLGLSPSFWNYLPFVYQAGGTFVEGGGSEVTLGSDEAVQAMEFFLTLAQNGGLVVPESVENPLDGFPYRPTRQLVEAFAEGGVAMLIVPNVTYQILSEAGIGFNIAVAELPEGPAGRATLPYVTGFGIHDPGAVTSAEAVSLLRFLVGPGQEFWIESPTYMPADPGLRSAWLEIHPDAGAFMAGAEYMVNYQPQASSFNLIAEFDAQASEILSSALTGEIDPVEAVNQLDAAARRMVEG